MSADISVHDVDATNITVRIRQYAVAPCFGTLEISVGNDRITYFASGGDAAEELRVALRVALNDESNVESVR